MFSHQVYNTILVVLGSAISLAAFAGFLEQFRVVVSKRDCPKNKLIWFIFSNLIMSPMVIGGIWLAKPWTIPYRLDDGSVILWGFILLFNGFVCILAPMLFILQLRDLVDMIKKRPS